MKKAALVVLISIACSTAAQAIEVGTEIRQEPVEFTISKVLCTSQGCTAYDENNKIRMTFSGTSYNFTISILNSNSNSVFSRYFRDTDPEVSIFNRLLATGQGLCTYKIVMDRKTLNLEDSQFRCREKEATAEISRIKGLFMDYERELELSDGINEVLTMRNPDYYYNAREQEFPYQVSALLPMSSAGNAKASVGYRGIKKLNKADLSAISSVLRLRSKCSPNTIRIKYDVESGELKSFKLLCDPLAEIKSDNQAG